MQKIIKGIGLLLLAVVIIVLLPLLLVILLVILLGLGLWHFGLLVSVWVFWCAKGRNVLFVYSDSPNWKGYIEENYFTRFDNKVVVLNWSEREKWKTNLAVLVFRRWGGSREFNPLGIVFQPFHKTRVFRFYKPFIEFKHDKPEALQKLETEFFERVV